MKWMSVILIFTAVVNVHAIGADISMYFPEDGSVSFERGITPRLKLFGGIIGIPFGFEFNKIYGLKVDNEPMASGKWFYADTMTFLLMLDVQIPIDMFYLKFGAGGMAVLCTSLTPLTGNIDRDIAAKYGYDTVTSTLNFESQAGFGYLYGGAFGVRFGQISVELFVYYSFATAPLSISGTYKYSAGAATGSGTYNNPDALLRFSGFRVGIGVDYDMKLF